MVVLELDKVEIDYCPGCEGVWLDAGELEILLEGSEQRDVFLDSFAIQEKSGEKKRKCPICRKKMDKISFGSGSGDRKITIDECRKKHGIWFDKGELKRVLTEGGLQSHHRVLELLREVFKQ
jgi:hypothetical protein